VSHRPAPEKRESRGSSPEEFKSLWGSFGPQIFATRLLCTTLTLGRAYESLLGKGPGIAESNDWGKTTLTYVPDGPEPTWCLRKGAGCEEIYSRRRRLLVSSLFEFLSLYAVDPNQVLVWADEYMLEADIRFWELRNDEEDVP